MTATDAQVQNFSDTRIRPHCEKARDLKLSFDNDRATIDDVYNAVSEESPTWEDSRTSDVPHSLTPSDVLAVNAFMEDVRNYMGSHGSWSVILKACVRSI